MSEGMTSYEKVYRLLRETYTCKSIWDNAYQTLKECKIEKVSFTLRQTSDESKASAIFHFTGDFQWGELYYDGCECNVNNFLTGEMAKSVIDAHYGPDKDVKTRNCKHEIVLKGGYISRKTEYGRNKERQESFIQWLKNQFEYENRDLLKETTQRLQSEVKTQLETVHQARQEALVSFCKNDITKALLPWHGMDEHILQDAWNQFICTVIMNT